MTRKDYIRIAALLQSTRNLNTGDKSDHVEQFILNIENGMCAAFYEDNNRFDEDRFRAAANYKGES